MFAFTFGFEEAEDVELGVTSFAVFFWKNDLAVDERRGGGLRTWKGIGG